MSTVYVLETNMAGNGAIAIMEAKKLGFKTKFICTDVKEYSRAVFNPCEIADEVCEVNTYDITKLFHFFEYEKIEEKIEGVIAFDDFRIIQAALINERYANKVGSSVNSIMTCRFKDLMRNALKGTPHSTSHSVFDFSSMPKDSPISYPCVIKPVDESGSVGVHVCYGKKDFLNAMDDILAFAKPNSRGYCIAKKMIVEEYIEGEEYSAEMAWNGESQIWELIGITKKFLSPFPYRVEVGHIFPFECDEEFRNDVKNQLNFIFSRIGLKNTFAHVEFKIIEGVLKIIEINPRVGGGQIADLMELVTDVNPVKLYFRTFFNLPIQDYLEKIKKTAKNKFASIAFLFSYEKGKVIEIKKLEEWKELKKIFTSSLPKDINGLTNAEDRLGFVIQEFDAFDKAVKFINSCTSKFQIKVV